jgi:hypothetical protein
MSQYNITQFVKCVRSLELSSDYVVVVVVIIIIIIIIIKYGLFYSSVVKVGLTMTLRQESPVMKPYLFSKPILYIL